MKREPSGSCLSAVFVDYDNIYLSLKRKSEDAAKRFAKDAAQWIREIENGRLITPTNGLPASIGRRLVMNRCYGNPVPRRNSRDNSTDMNSFPFVRHHFLRAGFEVVDCPPLTAQLKNSSDIRMVMDVRDYLTHDTYFDEFVILSGDADFTPVLHRLRAHARRTVIFANEHTASPYTAICDGEIREEDLISLLLDGRVAEARPVPAPAGRLPSPEEQAEQRKEIVERVVEAVQTAPAPVPIEALADKAQRSLGHDKTVGTNWGGSGTFRNLLTENLPQDIQLSERAPYVAYDSTRHAPPADPARQAPEPQQLSAPAVARPVAMAASVPLAQQPMLQPVAPMPSMIAPQAAEVRSQAAPPSAQSGPAARKPVLAQQPLANLQKSIARIHEACKAPPLAPPEYRQLFEAMAAEITENGLAGAQTLTNVVNRAKTRGFEAKREDVRFVLDVVSEADPWFEQGASANLFAGRFRNFVVARCRSQGLSLSADEVDLIDAWFAGGPAGGGAAARQVTAPQRPPAPVAPPAQQPERAWQGQEQRQQFSAPPLAEPAYDPMGQDVAAMPRFVRGIRG